jgi:hypothetical protein
MGSTSEVQKLVSRGASDKRVRVRQHAIAVVSDADFPQYRNLIEPLTEDDSPTVREDAANRIDKWDIRAGRMDEGERNLRLIAEQAAASDDANLRKSLAITLRGQRASWALRLARRLSKDPDPEVRLLMEEVVSAWPT